jgi:hypothetical protein
MGVKDKQYREMEYAWISSATRLYPIYPNIELEAEIFKKWYNNPDRNNINSCVIAVISLDVEDFISWKDSSGFKPVEVNNKKKFKIGDVTYYCISGLCDLCSLTINEVIETENANGNEHYDEIKSSIVANIVERPTIKNNNETLTLPDIRNKLSPIKNLIAMLEDSDIQYPNEMRERIIKREIENCKKSVDYLSGKC